MGYWRNYGCRMDVQAGFQGFEAVVLENAALRVVVLPAKGADIVSFLYKPADVDFMWVSPTGLRDPRWTVTTNVPEEGSFMDFYEGAWQEVLPSGGPHASYNGTEWGLHGELATAPWQVKVVEDSPDEVAVEFSIELYRAPLKLQRTMRLTGSRPVLYLEEKLTNLAPEPFDLMWGHHPAIGEPWLDESCLVDVPAGRVLVHPEPYAPTQRLKEGAEGKWPFAPLQAGGEADLSKVLPRSAHTLDLAYLTDLEAGWYGLTNTRQGLGFGMAWDKDVFPYLWYWQSFGGGEGYPWYGRTYNVALEPWTSWPASGLEAAQANGSQVKLGPHEVIETTLCALAYEAPKGILGISSAGEVKPR